MNTALVELDSLVSSDDLSVSPVTPSEIVDETSDDAPTGSSKPTDHIAKSIRNKFYRNIKFYESNWSAECVICHKAQYDKKGVTSNINRHIKTQHTKEYKEWFSQLHSKDKDQKKISDMFTDRRNKSTETSSKSLYGKMHPRQVQLAQSIVNDLIIDLGLPLSLVERLAFIEFMKIVDPKFTLTSRRTLSRSTIPKLYDQMNEKLKVLCDQSRFISLTLDLWTDRRTRSFFAMTGHTFVEKSLKSFVLCFLPLYGSHTANLLLQTYESVIDSYGIEEKLVRLVTDHGANNMKAFQDLILPGFDNYFDAEDEDYEGVSDTDLDGFIEELSDESGIEPISTDEAATITLIRDSFDNVASNNESLRIPCFAHTIQLVVNDGLKETSSIRSALSKVSRIAKLSHTSTIFAEKLELMGKSIPMANRTRWNSQFYTVEKVLRIPSVELNDILISLRRKDLCLLSKDYEMLNEFSSLLTLLADATTMTQSEHVPSISIIAPTILVIYFDLLNEQSNIVHTSSLCSALLNSLMSRFGGILEQLGIELDQSIRKKNSFDLYRDEIFIYAPFLDARFKLHWITESSLPPAKKNFLCDKITRLIYDHCVLLHRNDSSSTTQEGSVGEIEEEPLTTAPLPLKSTPKRKSLFSSIENKTVKKVKVDALQFIKTEISNYLNDNESNCFTLIEKCREYKSLTVLAVKILSVPATSSPVGRIFSQSGFLFRQHRAKMSRRTL